ncbi:MAG: hypothetical protein NZ519_06435, partial [Bacteroidia bacterium]|nr:hypothetical protein [Bacteroidia bacterium]
LNQPHNHYNIKNLMCEHLVDIIQKHLTFVADVNPKEDDKNFVQTVKYYQISSFKNIDGANFYFIFKLYKEDQRSNRIRFYSVSQNPPK